MDVSFTVPDGHLADEPSNDNWQSQYSADGSSWTDNSTAFDGDRTFQEYEADFPGYFYRGRYRENGDWSFWSVPIQLPFAPVLSTDGTGSLAWTWAGSDPYNWRFFQSDDGVSGWVSFGYAVGADRSKTGFVPTKYYMFYGETSLGVQTTSTSNVVQAT